MQLGDLQNLLRDVNFGGITGKLLSADNLASYGLNRLLKGLSRVKKFSEDAYTLKYQSFGKSLLLLVKVKD